MNVKKFTWTDKNGVESKLWELELTHLKNIIKKVEKGYWYCVGEPGDADCEYTVDRDLLLLLNYELTRRGSNENI